MVESCKSECSTVNELYERAKLKIVNCLETTAQKKMITKYETYAKDVIGICMAIQDTESTENLLEKLRIYSKRAEKAIGDLTSLARWVDYFKDELKNVEPCDPP